MTISLTHKRVVSLNLITLSDGEIELKNNVRLTMGSELFLNSNHKNMIRVRYPVSLIIKDKIMIDVEYDFYFSATEEFTPDIIDSPLLRTKMPSLAYPYIKSYLDNLVFASGYDSTTIPFLDFMEEPLELTPKD